MTENKTEVVDISLDDIVMYEKNTKKHPQEQISKIKKSIKEFGFNVPIIVDKDNELIAGHGRVLAAQQLGMSHLPAIRKDSLTEEQVKAYRIADNKSAESEWIMDYLKEELISLDQNGFDLELTGFDKKELVAILGDEYSNGEAQEDDFEEPKEAKYEVKIGDVWELGEHRLMCGDATKKEDVDVLMGGCKSNLFLTDPPYSVNFTKKSKELFNNKNHCEIMNDSMSVNETSKKIWSPVFKNAYEISEDNSPFYVFMPQGGDQMMMMMMMNEKWNVKHELIWEKEGAVFSMNRLDYDYKHEPIMYGWKKTHNFYGDHKDTSVLKINRDGDGSHPTMKPIELLSKIINNSSKQNDTVLDLFGGSGSTLIACEQLKRKCYMMELDPFYCSVIIERWENLTSCKAVKI